MVRMCFCVNSRVVVRGIHAGELNTWAGEDETGHEQERDDERADAEANHTLELEVHRLDDEAADQGAQKPGRDRYHTCEMESIPATGHAGRELRLRNRQLGRRVDSVI